MATALELGPEGWKPYIEALRQRPEPVLTPETITERDRLIEMARDAAGMLRRDYGAKRVWLFGSLVHQAWFDEASDVDLAVDGVDSGSFWSAWGAVEKLMSDRSFDLVELRSASASLRRYVLEHGREL